MNNGSMDLQPADPVQSETPPVQTNGTANNLPPVIINTQKDRPRLNVKLLIFATSLIAGLLLVLPLGLSAYGVRIPFVSAQMQKTLAIAVYKIPLLPKTPQQILFAASNTNKVLTSYTPDFSVSMALSGSTINAASFDLNLVGPVDFTDPAQPKFDVVIDVGANLAGNTYQGNGKIRGIGPKIYFKLEQLPEEVQKGLSGGLLGMMGGGGFEDQPEISDEVKRNLEEVMKNWIVYDTSGLDTPARQAMDEQKRNQSLVDSSRESIQEFLSRGTVLPDVKLVGKEEIEGTMSYHLKLVPSPKTLREIVAEMTPKEKRQDPDIQKTIDAISGHIDLFSAEAWFGVADSIPRKMIVTAQINLGSLVQSLMAAGPGSAGIMPSMESLPFGNLAAGKISMSTVLVLKDIGKEVIVTEPAPVLEAAEYMQAVQEAAKTQTQKDAEARQKQIDVDLRQIGMKLGESYVETAGYPVNLATMFPNQYREYTYRQKAGGRGYVVYIQHQAAGSGMRFYSAPDSTPTPYYGISSEYPYPHQITQRDLD